MSTNHASFAIKNPMPYTGEVTRPGSPKATEKTCTIIEAANTLDLPALLERHGEWAICEDGIHCLYSHYFIGKFQLDEDDWIDQVSEKQGVVTSEFIAALERAKEMFGVSE